MATIVINDKKLVYDEFHGRYNTKYNIIENETQLEGDDLVRELCPCGLIFGYSKSSDGKCYIINTD